MKRRSTRKLLWVLQPLSITLRGITNAAADPSIDVWRTVTLPLLRQATGLSDGFELKVIKRGAEPLVSVVPDSEWERVHMTLHCYCCLSVTLHQHTRLLSCAHKVSCLHVGT